jgi:hypothetical protein
MGALRRCAAHNGIAPLLARQQQQQQQMQRVAAAGAASGLLALGFYSTSDAQSRFDLASATGPLVRLLDAETSHRVGILAAKLGLFPKETRADPESLRVDLWGKQFRNPLGEAPRGGQLGSPGGGRWRPPYTSCGCLTAPRARRPRRPGRRLRQGRGGDRAHAGPGLWLHGSG